MNIKDKFVKYEPSAIIFYNQDREVLLKETSLIAVSVASYSILTLGNEVEREVGKSNDVLIGSPLKNGVIADFELAKLMFKIYLSNISKRKLLGKPKIALCVPVNMTQVEHQAYSELILSIGGKDALIIEEPYEKAVNDIPHTYKIIIEILPDIKDR